MSRTTLPGILVTPLLLLAGFGHANPAAAMTPAPKAETTAVIETKITVGTDMSEAFRTFAGRLEAGEVLEHLHRQHAGRMRKAPGGT